MKAFLKYHIYDRLVLWEKARQLKFWKQNKPIIVHTMAKVGSLSVYSSLKKQLPKTSLFHTHSLDLNEVSENVDLCFKNGVYPGSRSPAFLIQNEIAPNRLTYKGYGPLNPIADNKYRWGRDKNRRIEIKIIKTETGFFK